ncbi:hypothetical protein KA977_15115 [Candidatus Dependentiae bacterium]|nr:hypothetical protein [Candidatus Dependentiae bacterium]
MQAYKFETTITEPGKIEMPFDYRILINHKVEILLLDTGKYGSEKEKI